jgi:hypothetical protein
MDDELVLRIESGDARVLGDRWSNTLYLAADWEPFALVDRGVAEAAAISGETLLVAAATQILIWGALEVTCCTCLHSQPDRLKCINRLLCSSLLCYACKWRNCLAGYERWKIHAATGGAKPLREKQLPGLLDVFGWCTWDAYYSRVSARGELV